MRDDPVKSKVTVSNAHLHAMTHEDAAQGPPDDQGEIHMEEAGSEVSGSDRESEDGPKHMATGKLIGTL